MIFMKPLMKFIQWGVIVRKIYLTPFDQNLLDPSGANRRMLKRMDVKVQTFTPKPKIMYLAGTQYFERWLERTQRLACNAGKRHADYYAWNNDYASKYGPQGGSFPLKYVLQSYERSYELATRNIAFNYATIGSEWLQRYCEQLVSVYGHPQYYGVPVSGTNAALPTGLKKGQFAAETLGAKPYRHYVPNLPGQRYQRGKFRTINQDSILNVRLTEKPLSACRHFLAQYIPELFGSWLNPETVIQPVCTEIVDKKLYSVETDYEKMDEHFSLEATQAIVLPIYEKLLTPGEYQFFSMYIEEMFFQPIYLGLELWTGKHNLLSGQNPTNDFETIMQVCQAAGVLLSMGLDPLKILQLHLGDDQVVAFRRKADAEQFRMLFIEESELNGLAINLEKSAIRHGQVQYCRKLYYAGGRRHMGSDGKSLLYGAYPSWLALNSIVNPERMSETPGIQACATYQRLDNCIGSPDFIELLQFIGRHSKLVDTNFTEVDALRYSSKDWWYRLYGERWAPEVSPSFRLLHGLITKID